MIRLGSVKLKPNLYLAALAFVEDIVQCVQWLLICLFLLKLNSEQLGSTYPLPGHVFSLSLPLPLLFHCFSILFVYSFVFAVFFPCLLRSTVFVYPTLVTSSSSSSSIIIKTFISYLKLYGANFF